MKHIFNIGDVKAFSKVVSMEDAAAFHSEVLHPVYATFALARDFEWSSRLFFLEMKEGNEEGVGTFVHVEHKRPAKVGQSVQIEATVESIRGNELVCTIEARSQNYVIATGRTGQKMLTKEKLKKLFGE